MNKIHQKGLSLVELMIGIVLASVIIAGVIQVFLSNRQAFVLTESLVRIQENGRFALNFVGAAVRDAGNYGCVTEYDAANDNIKEWIDGTDGMDGSDSFGAVVANKSDDGDAVEEDSSGVFPSFDAPDTLALLTVTSNSSIIDSIATGTTKITLEANSQATFAKDDWLLVSNCLVGDFIAASSGTSTNTTTNVSTIDYSDTTNFRASQYTSASQVSTVSEVKQLVFAVDSAKNQLTVNENNNGATALLDGIENVQFTYGVDTDGNYVPDYFDDIDTITTAGDQNDIIAVKVYVLAVSNLVSTSQVVSDPQTITFNDRSVAMTDSELRKVFESTITLRNRMN